MKDEIIKTTCTLCPVACGALVHMLGGKPIKIEGDPDCPSNKGQLCIKGNAALEYLNHPSRLTHPLKRTGKRGGGKFKRISWEEAIGTIAAEFGKIKEESGPEAVAFFRGSGKGLQDNWLHRFANAFGSPNLCSSRHVCDSPRIEASLMTFGYSAAPDYENYQPSCIISWGINQKESRHNVHRQTLEVVQKGTKLIVVNPNALDIVEKADCFLQLRPGTDLALGLAMLNVIINEELYDKGFVEKWTIGFSELKTHVQAYTPEKVSETTWLDAEKIKEAARLYACNRPSVIEWGNGIDQNRNSFQTARALAIMRAIIGNLDVPGGDLQRMQPGLQPRFGAALTLFDKMPVEQRRKAVGAEFKIMNNVNEGVQQLILQAMITGKPYPVRAVYNMTSNTLLTAGNAQNAYRALNKLDFSVAVDMFMTPTTAMADIVLPVTSFLESDSVQVMARYGAIRIQRKVADEVGECWSDYKMLSELAKKLGLGEYFWDNEEKALDFVLEPIGIRYKEFKSIEALLGPMKYRKYEKNGFNTPSRKVELYSSRLKEWGYDPLPIYHELPETHQSDPELAKEYPLYCICRKSEVYRHTCGRQIQSLREVHPEPIVKMNPETAKKLKIESGEWVYIETKRGRIKQKAALTKSIDPRVVDIDFGWWFPEKGIGELFDWKSSNLNIITSDDGPYNPEIGTLNLRGICCKVYSDKT